MIICLVSCPQHQEKLDAQQATEDAARRKQQRMRQLNQQPTGKAVSQPPSHSQSPTRPHLHVDTTDAAQLLADHAHASSDIGTGAIAAAASEPRDGADASALPLPLPVAAPSDAETVARPLLSPTEELRRLIQNEMRFANIASHHSRASGFHADPHRLKRLPTAAGDSSDDEARRGHQSGDDIEGNRSRGHSFHRQPSQSQTDGAHSVDAAAYTAFAAFAEMRGAHVEGGGRDGDGVAPASFLPDASRIPCVC